MISANARTALITRGLVEMQRLGAALGADAKTFMGMAGLGDLVLTCTDNQSRNRRFGLALGAGKSVETAMTEIGQVVEGYRNTKEVHRMGDLIRYPVMKTVKDAAAIYGLPPTYIRTLCRTGKIRYVVAGHRWLVNMNSLAKYFNEGDPVPAGQDEAVGGIRRVVGR